MPRAGSGGTRSRRGSGVSRIPHASSTAPVLSASGPSTNHKLTGLRAGAGLPDPSRSPIPAPLPGVLLPHFVLIASREAFLSEKCVWRKKSERFRLRNPFRRLEPDAVLCVADSTDQALPPPGTCGCPSCDCASNCPTNVSRTVRATSVPGSGRACVWRAEQVADPAAPHGPVAASGIPHEAGPTERRKERMFAGCRTCPPDVRKGPRRAHHLQRRRARPLDWFRQPNTQTRPCVRLSAGFTPPIEPSGLQA